MNNDLNKRVWMELTATYKLKAAEKYIKTLNQNKGQDQAYIAELEYKLQESEKDREKLQKKVDNLKLQYKSITDKYSQDMKQMLSIDDIYLKQKSKIEKLYEEIANLIQIRDELIYKLNNK